MNELRPIERAALEAIANSDVRGAHLIREQLPSMRVLRREESPVGFFVHFAKDDIHTPNRHWTGNVVASVPGLKLGIGFVALIENDVVVMLEAFTFGDEQLPDEITDFEINAVGS